MIATRFRSVGLVCGVAVAAIGCYLVSQRVASERATLAKVERRILMTQREIRQLQTEIGTRGGLRQLEKWNAEVLALSAPKASQFLDGEVHLASYYQPAQPIAPALPGTAPAIAPTVGPKVIQASFQSPKPAAPAAAAPRPATPRPSTPAPAVEQAPQPMLRQATYIKPKGASAPEPQRVALLGDDILGELGRMARSERNGNRKGNR